MARTGRNGRNIMEFPGLNISKLKKELKLIPFDIQREKRFMDLLFSEKNSVRTQTERDVLVEMIDKTTRTVESYQSRFRRYRECYDQIKDRKSFDSGLLSPDELHSLRHFADTGLAETEFGGVGSLRTGTHG